MIHRSEDFGMREFKTNGTHFEVNGQQIFLRGTVECSIFPLTGYPPTDVKSWEKVLQTCKDYGLNHIGFIHVALLKRLLLQLINLEFIFI